MTSPSTDTTGEVSVQIAAGGLRGKATDSGYEFLGIPYATAERFTPPVAVTRWEGLRHAVTAGPAAPQPRREVGEFTHGALPRTDERGCLNLNVFAPALDDGARPVFVWIHGGGLALGHASASIYHGARLAAAADAVVITVNYRLGTLGWLAHPDLADDATGAMGNWGLLDQIAALEWVRDNVAAFGGDPAKVTVAGQSAGAMSVMNLLVSPRATGLFARAVLQSPPFQQLQSADDAARWARALSALGGAGSFDGEALRSLPVETIVALHEELLEQNEFRATRGAQPVADPATLPLSAGEDPSASVRVPVLIGTNADESTFFTRTPEHSTAPAAFDVEQARKLTEDLFVAPLGRWARARAAAGGRVHRYRFDHRGAGPVMGATHTAEVPLLFGTWEDGGPGERLGGQAPGASEVAAELVRAWTRFIHGEDPGWEPTGAVPHGRELGVFGGRTPFATEISDT